MRCAARPAPLHGGPLALLRFMHRHDMLTPRLRGPSCSGSGMLKLHFGRRLQTDGLCFICPGVKLEIGRGATLRIGRWAWLGPGARSGCTRAR